MDEKKYEFAAYDEMKNLLRQREDDDKDYIFVSINEEGEVVAQYYTDIVTIAQASKLLLSIVKSQLDDATDEEREALKAIIN